MSTTATLDPDTAQDTEALDAAADDIDNQDAGQDYLDAPAYGDRQALHGPRAARNMAQQLAEDGHHSHLNAEGQSHCMSGLCSLPLLDFGPGAH